MITVEVGFGFTLADQSLKFLFRQVIPNVLIQMRVGVVFAQFEMIASFRYMPVRAAVQVMHTGNVFLVLVDAILDVLLGLGHDAVIVPAELWCNGRFARGSFLPEPAHARLLGSVGSRGTLQVARGGSVLHIPVLD